MARVVKPEDPYEVFRMQSDTQPGWKLCLIKGGRVAYIWTPMGTYSGTESLRKLAKAILKEIPRQRKKGRKS